MKHASGVDVVSRERGGVGEDVHRGHGRRRRDRRRRDRRHLLLVAAKLCGADVGGVAGVAYYYKNAMACRNAAAASIVMHAAAVGATL